jgi:integrase/recombinase XerD
VKIADAVQEYVVYKQALGMSYKGPALKLNAFARFVGPIHLDQVTPDMVRNFLNGHGTVTTVWFSKLGVLNTFFRFALARGYTKENPLPRTKPKSPRQFRPYIYSVEEVKKMIQVVDCRHRGRWHLEPRTVRTLLLLLYGTGLRIGEAIRLQHRDVDLRERILTVRETKFYKSRFVPVSPDLADLLQDHLRKQWEGRPSTPNSPFLATYDGRPVTHLTAELAFKRIRYEAGVRRADGFYYQPRLHDFRHTFAVRRLIAWYREGKNVQRLLPHLATYLGHVSIRETSRYLTMTKELLSEAGQRFERYASQGGMR